MNISDAEKDNNIIATYLFGVQLTENKKNWTVLDRDAKFVISVPEEKNNTLDVAKTILYCTYSITVEGFSLSRWCSRHPVNVDWRFLHMRTVAATEPGETQQQWVRSVSASGTMSRNYNDELQFLEKIGSNCWRIKKGFVPNMQVGGAAGASSELCVSTCRLADKTSSRQWRVGLLLCFFV